MITYHAMFLLMWMVIYHPCLNLGRHRRVRRHIHITPDHSIAKKQAHPHQTNSKTRNLTFIFSAIAIESHLVIIIITPSHRIVSQSITMSSSPHSLARSITLEIVESILEKRTPWKAPTEFQEKRRREMIRSWVFGIELLVSVR